MSELHQFILKRTASFSGITSRKLYGLDAFYLRDLPFVVISSKEQIVIKVDDFEVQTALLKTPDVTIWMLDGKTMPNWFVLPDTFNKKKNKIDPILEMTSKVLLNPKKKKKVRKKKPKSKNLKDTKHMDKDIKVKSSIFKKMMNFFS